MKNVLKYFSFVFMLLATTLVSCSDDDVAGAGSDVLSIKVFAPTKVVPGQPVTINGSGFDKATAVVFPGGVTVSDFEIVADGMIRVTTPAGISEAGKLTVRSASDEVQSPLNMTLGCTVPRTFSKQEGDTVKTKEILWFYGQDMEFINKVTFLDSEDNEIVVEQKDFNRIATGRLAVKVPDNVKLDNPFAGKFSTFDGKTFDLPTFTYQRGGSGHWETVTNILWKNGRESTIPAPNWSGEGRFAGADFATGEETWAFPMDQWEAMKANPFRVMIEPIDEYPNIRVTTGWWSTDMGGKEFNNWEIVEVDEAGNYFFEVDLQAWPELLANVDAQHLLFTGSGYKVLAIYTEETIWVDGGGHFETQRISYWKNGRESEIPAPNWSGEGRFAGADFATGEETWAFPMDQWEKLKAEPFRIQIEPLADWPNVRITTGWWSTDMGGKEFNNWEIVEVDEAGNYFIEVNLQEWPDLLGLVDAQHLLFTGSDYRLLEIYQETEVWVEEGDGPSKKEVVIWQNDGSMGAINWSSDYRFANEEHPTGEECYVIPMSQWDVIKNGTFYLTAQGSDWVQMRITSGWWTTTWTGDDICTGSDRIVDNGDGTYTIEINFAGDPLLDYLDEQHLLFTGGGYTPLKIFYYE